MIGGAHTDTPAGAGGLESACNKELAGTNGVYDKKLPVKERNEKAAPKPGSDVQTTLVPTLQKSVAEALATACATNGAESAWGLVMKIPSGEIEAMASWPTFDPSMRRDLDKWNSSMAVNRAAQFLFEPGGLVKPLTYAIALDEGVLAEDAKLDQGDGTWKYNGVTLKDEATNTLSIAEAIERRVNIAAGAMQIVSPVAADAIVRMLKTPMPSTVQMSEHDKESGCPVYSPTNYIASCAGFYPGDRPQRVIVVSFVKPRTAHTGDEVAKLVLDAITDAL